MKQNFKIALYVRVSTEEQAENPEGSIRNQEERLREFVKLKNMVSPFGEIRKVFTDAGISAKDMNRPAFQRLLRKIEDREINLVLVTELSLYTFHQGFFDPVGVPGEARVQVPEHQGQLRHLDRRR